MFTHTQSVLTYKNNCLSLPTRTYQLQQNIHNFTHSETYSGRPIYTYLTEGERYVYSLLMLYAWDILKNISLGD